MQQALYYYLLLNLTPFTEEHNVRWNSAGHEIGEAPTTQGLPVRAITPHLYLRLRHNIFNLCFRFILQNTSTLHCHNFLSKAFSVSVEAICLRN
jgi:hypothetical protein